jgi:protein-disulfide isomerase
MSVQSQRGRKVAARKRNNLAIFYIAIGAVLLIGVAALVTVALRNGNSAVTAVNAPVGRTAEGFYYKGDPEAAVKVIAYEDFQCPACAFYNKNLAPLVTRDYIETGKIQFIYHEFPLDIHENAVPSGEAARCAADQNPAKFWEMHDMLFVNQALWAQASAPANLFSSYAGQIGLNRASFDSCMSAGTHNAAVVAAGEGAIAAGANATPTFSVNGQLVDSNGLIPAIDAALRAAGQ